MSSPTKRPEPLDPASTHTTATTAPAEERERAWKAVEHEAMALAEGDIDVVSVDLHAAANRSLAVVAALLRDAALCARIERTAQIGEAPAGALGRIVLLANAAWHARHCQGLAEVQLDRAKVPGAVIARATTVRNRMRVVVRHFLGAHPVDGAIAMSVGRRKGYKTLADDLVTLADLYARHATVVAGDSVHHVATDERDARTASREISEALGGGESPEHAQWTRCCARVWTLLARSYGDLQATGLWLLRGAPEEAARRFPSLVAGSRNARKAGDAPVDGGAVAPGDVTPVTPHAAAVPAKRARRSR